MNLTDALIDLLLVIFVVVCALMGLAIMMQRSKQEGLGTAFGGGMTSEMFGAGASSVLVKATVVLAALFFIISISLARLYSHKESLASAGQHSGVQQLLVPTAPASTDAAPVVVPESQPMPSTAPSAPGAPVAPAPVAPPAK